MDLLEEIHAVDLAHAEVGHHDVRLCGTETCEGGLGAGGGDHFESHRLEAQRYQPEDVRVVIDHEYFSGVFAHFGLAP